MREGFHSKATLYLRRPPNLGSQLYRFWVQLQQLQLYDFSVQLRYITKLRSNGRKIDLLERKAVKL